MSPNGRWLALSLNPNQTIWIYDFATSQLFRPKGIQTNGVYPFWSPDSTELGYFSGDPALPDMKVWRVTIRDGVPRPVCDIQLAGRPPVPGWRMEASSCRAAAQAC